jgi:hypothetical protein
VYLFLERRDIILNYVGLQAKYLLFSCDFNRNLIWSSGFTKISNVKCYENSSRGSRAVPYEQTDKRKLAIAFGKFCEGAEKCVGVI